MCKGREIKGEPKIRVSEIFGYLKINANRQPGCVPRRLFSNKILETEGRVRIRESLSRTAQRRRVGRALIYFRAIARRRKRPGQAEIFDRRRDAAVSFISRQEQDPRKSFRPRTGPSRDVIVARHLSPSRLPPLRAGDFFLFHVKTR